MIIAAVAVLFGMCYCIFNYWFQNERYKTMPREQLARQKAVSSPVFWLSMSVILFILLLGIISYTIYRYYIILINT